MLLGRSEAVLAIFEQRLKAFCSCFPTLAAPKDTTHECEELKFQGNFYALMETVIVGE